MNFKNFLILTIFVTVTSACSKSDNSTSGSSSSVVNTIDGTYINCSDNGNQTSSQVVVIISNAGTKLSEAITNYTATGNCTGASNPNFSFTADSTFGEIGKSTYLSDATDLSLIPSVDISSGCSKGAPVYTLLMFAANFESFKASSGQPACAANAVNTTISQQVFIRQ